MGGFFLWIWKKYKNTDFVFNKAALNNAHLLEKVNNIDEFLLDLNCAIHPMCFKILGGHPEITNLDKLEKKMMNQVIEYIDTLVKYVDPKKTVYLAIDGVAPAAKIKQQRYRRFKSVHDRELFDNIKKKHNKPVTKFWNNSAITPGTEFMERLHYKVLAWAQKKNLEVIYSSCKTPAEGEHKLLQFIRDNIKEDKKFSYVMYGLDADLIFLCLSTNAPDMYLLREAREFDNRNKSDDLNYVSIDLMRVLIKDTMEELIDVDKKESVIDAKYTDNIINDFIFICYLLGNDFLPHLPALDIYSDGLDILIKKYAETWNSLCEYCVDVSIDDFKLNINFFSVLLNNISIDEEDILRKQFHKKPYRRRCDSSDPYDR